MPELRSVYQVKVPGTAVGASSTAETQLTDSTGSLAVCYLPGSSKMTLYGGGRPFIVRAFGRTTTGASTNVTIKLYYGVSATIGSNTLIEASTARAINSTSSNWYIEAVCMCDTTSQKITGYGCANVNNLFDTTAALDNAPTSVDLTVEGLGFTATVTHSASNASTATRLLGFEYIPL